MTHAGLVKPKLAQIYKTNSILESALNLSILLWLVSVFVVALKFFGGVNCGVKFFVSDRRCWISRKRLSGKYRSQRDVFD
jgi:hypothetical protein